MSKRAMAAMALRRYMNGQDPESNRRLECHIIGVAAVLLAVVGILVIWLSAPWEIRFPIVAAASLFGRAIPALRLFYRMDAYCLPDGRLSSAWCMGVGMNIAYAGRYRAGNGKVMVYHNFY